MMDLSFILHCISWVLHYELPAAISPSCPTFERAIVNIPISPFSPAAAVCRQSTAAWLTAPRRRTTVVLISIAARGLIDLIIISVANKPTQRAKIKVKYRAESYSWFACDFAGQCKKPSFILFYFLSSVTLELCFRVRSEWETTAWVGLRSRADLP